MLTVKNQTFDAERALYGLCDAEVSECNFDGPADGESALKESHNIEVSDCRFALRYPLWHTGDFSLENCIMTDTSRAAVWYAQNGNIKNSTLGGIKALRESRNISFADCDIKSDEFGWRCSGITLESCKLESVYAFFESQDITAIDLIFGGKYSFQYVENAEFSNCVFDTKDAFWHSKNITVKNSIVRGEYLGWYSEGLTLIDCTITGTQPLCYCKNLRLINCVMKNTDLSFEYSDVEATVKGEILSVKNPLSGSITAGGYGEIILKDSVKECNCKIITT